MRTKTLKALPKTIKEFDKEFELYEGNIYCNVSFYKYSPELKRSKYIAHMIVLEPWKLSNYKNTLLAEKEAISKFLAKRKEVNNENSVFHGVFDIRKGIRFLPDIGFYRFITNNSPKTEGELNIRFGPAVCLLPKSFSFLVITPIARLFKEGESYHFVSNYHDALTAINNVKKMPETFVI